MNPYLVVGGGISGLLSAKVLKRENLPFTGLESSDRLGGRLMMGHHRLYEQASIDFLSEQVSDLSWQTVDAPPKGRKKGKDPSSNDASFECEDFYLRTPYYHPETTYEGIVERLSSELGHRFLTNKSVIRIEPNDKILFCQDGTSFSYEKIIWCASLALLDKVWHGDRRPLANALKKNKKGFGGLNLDLDLDLTLQEFQFPNTVVFPFRFKDKTFRALGMTARLCEDNREGVRLSWLLFLDHEDLENREEVAKIVRTLKREVFREFPELKARVRKDKIVYLSQLSGEVPALAENLELLKDLYYVGPQICLPGSHESLRNLDRTIANCQCLASQLPPPQRTDVIPVELTSAPFV